LTTLTIDLQDEGPPPVFLLGGALDLATRVRIDETLLPGVRDGWRDVVLDLTWLSYLDSLGLEAIARLAASTRGRVLLRNAHGLPRFVLESSETLSSVPNLRLEPRVGLAVDAMPAPPVAAVRPVRRPMPPRRPSHRSAPVAVRRISSHQERGGQGRDAPETRPA
jgi:hypothetical protein